MFFICKWGRKMHRLTCCTVFCCLTTLKLCIGQNNTKFEYCTVGPPRHPLCPHTPLSTPTRPHSCHLSTRGPSSLTVAGSARVPLLFYFFPFAKFQKCPCFVLLITNHACIQIKQTIYVKCLEFHLVSQYATFIHVKIFKFCFLHFLHK